MSAISATRRRLTGPTARRVLATVPLICVTVALHSAWLAGTFALWNMELARMQISADAGALAGASAGVDALGPAVASTVRERVAAFVGANNRRGHPQTVRVELLRRDPGTGSFAPANGTITDFDAVRVSIVRGGVLGAIGRIVFDRWLGWTPDEGRVEAVAEASAARRDPPRLARSLRLIE